jgi:ribonucleotide monophosphatase NagD (HAD superfamily)
MRRSTGGYVARAAMRGEADRPALAIGDGASTDIRGALDNGFEAVFIARGIHARHYFPAGPPTRPVCRPS